MAPRMLWVGVDRLFELDNRFVRIRARLVKAHRRDQIVCYRDARMAWIEAYGLLRQL